MRSVVKADELMEDAKEFEALQQDLRDVHDITWDFVGKVSKNMLSLQPAFA